MAEGNQEKYPGIPAGSGAVDFSAPDPSPKARIGQLKAKISQVFMRITQVSCRHCGACSALRISRAGFLQTKILSRLGIYPWKCGACGSEFLFPKRHQKSSHSPRTAFHAPNP